MTYPQFFLICSLILICSVLSFFAGRSGRKVKIVTIKQYDTVTEYDSVPSRRIDLYEDEEEAIVPTGDKK